LQNLGDPILSQYQASLEMLKQAISMCPETLWNDLADRNQFWHIAYHALFYTHLYIQEKVEKFTTWAQHRPHYEQLGPYLENSKGSPQIREPYSKAEMLAYLDFCTQEVADKMATVNLESDSSGFPWLPFGKLELQIYNIRHLQHHTAELMARLGEREQIDIDWVTMK
jgi:hypothetical protein